MRVRIWRVVQAGIQRMADRVTRRCLLNLAEAAGLADELSQKGRGRATGRARRGSAPTAADAVEKKRAGGSGRQSCPISDEICHFSRTAVRL